MPLTGNNLLQSIIDSSGVNLNNLLKITLSAKLQQMIDNGTYSNLAAAIAISGFSTEIKNSIDIIDLSDRVKVNKELIGASESLVDDDLISPVVTTATASYAENSAEGTVVFTVSADPIETDAVYSIESGNDNAFYEMDAATGEISLTQIGSVSAANDFEAVTGETTATNAFTLGVKVTDAAGNMSGVVDIVLSVTNTDDILVEPPISDDHIFASPTFSVAASETQVNEGNTATYTVSLSEVQTTDSHVDFGLVLAGGATSMDHGDVIADGVVTTTGTLDFSAGEMSKTITVATVIDASTEIDEIVEVELTNPSKGFELGTATASTTLVDLPMPTLISNYPQDNEIGVRVDQNIELYFNEPVEAGTGSIIISNGSNDVRTIDIGDSNQVAFFSDQGVVFINPTNDLLPDNNYFVEWDSGIVIDLVGNPVAGLNDEILFNFTTATI